MVKIRGRLRSWTTGYCGWVEKSMDLGRGAVQIRQNSSVASDSMGKWAISMIDISKERRASLESLIRGDFTSIYSRINTVSPQSAVPMSLLKLNNYKPKFPSIPNLGLLIEKGYMKEGIELIEKSYKEGHYLTFEEVQRLVIFASPYPWYAYEILSLYRNKYNWVEANDQILPLIMKLAFFNMDYKLFHDVFGEFLKFNSVIPTNLLILAIQVYLKTKDIRTATNLFNQYLMAESRPNHKVLNVFISGLFNLTNNHSLCLKSYQAWVGNNHSTSLDIDSFVYNTILENGTEEELAWIEKSLADRQLINSVGIKFGMEVSMKYSKDKLQYKQFMESDIPNKVKLKSIDEGCLSTVLNSFIYLHLRHQNYEEVLKTMEAMESHKEFNLAVFTILNHLEKLDCPELMFQFLKHLRTSIKFKFDHRHIIPYWRSLVNVYIHSGDRIHKRLMGAIRGSEYRTVEFLTKVLKIREMNKSSMSDIRWYPKINFRLSTEGQVSTKPFVENIESQVMKGILPNVNLLWKTISLCKNEDEYSRLREVIGTMETNGVSSSKIDIELFWRERSQGQWRPVDQFVTSQLAKVGERKLGDTSKDLIDMFHLAVKSNRIKEGKLVLTKMREMEKDIQFNDNQHTLKFLSMYIKWCFLNREFIDLVVVLEWIKTSPLVIDGFFVDGLRKGVDVYIQRMIKGFEKEYKDLPEYTVEKEKLHAVLPSVLKYYDSITMDLHRKVRESRRRVLEECDANFKEFIHWQDEDASTLLQAVQRFKAK